MYFLIYCVEDTPFTPAFFRACLEDMANIRRNSVTRAFIDALTRGGPGGTPRPIELQAHDPIRYIGDMLAWIHQAAASEREILEGLFDVEGQRGYSKCIKKCRADSVYPFIRFG
jgi:hypothetical protein